MATFRWLLVLSMLALGALSASAAEPSYPPGSRIGLTPPPGLVPSKTFFGYEDPNNSVAMVLVALPPQAYADLDASVTADALKRQGVTLESREALALPSGNAFLVVGRQEVDNTKIRKWILVASSPGVTGFVTVQMPETATAVYPDAAIRASLASLAFRAAVPVEEQLGLLPFKIGEFSGFRVAGVIPGRAVMLSDAPAGASGSPDSTNEPHIFAAIAPGAPAQSGDRDTFAREALATFPNIREIRVTTSEPLRMSGQQGHQIIADAKDATGKSALTLVQWLRFGSSGYMQIIGIARADAWKDAYPRFRSVRDGIEAR
jgi:hypothetical protein